MTIDPLDSWWVFPGFKLELLATGLHKPTNVATVPNPGRNDDDPILYVSMLYGQIKVITRGCHVLTYADDLLNYPPDFILPGPGESGVTGIQVEPGSGDVFASMLYQDGDGFKGKVMRMRGKLQAERIDTVLNDIPSIRGAHQIQAITFGFDHKMYVTTGDGLTTPETAQRDDDLRGKVLRYDLDGGIPSDNPHKESPVYAKGFRNPFGATWRRSDHALYITDNGHRTDDRIAKVVPGGNYGWSPNMRKNSLFWWHFTQAPTALDFMQDGQFPEEFHDELFVALAGPARYRSPSRKGKSIVKMRLNDGATGVRSYDDFLVYIGRGLGMPVGLSFGPGGLYFTDLHGEGDTYGQRPGGNVFRVVPIDGWRWF
ncbi:MAG: PQQ-dependent sugar dehydrogenase [Methanomassiliicoccus sp.]|nr:PQQ-dependent sugar dehydrogenase [Methanomassiliicoccus sp.]